MGNTRITVEKIKEVSQKQDTLISGSTIKTINGSSILGSGDIVISSGNSSLLSNGDSCVCVYNNCVDVKATNFVHINSACTCHGGFTKISVGNSPDLTMCECVPTDGTPGKGSFYANSRCISIWDCICNLNIFCASSTGATINNCRGIDGVFCRDGHICLVACCNQSEGRAVSIIHCSHLSGTCASGFCMCNNNYVTGLNCCADMNIHNIVDNGQSDFNTSFKSCVCTSSHDNNLSIVASSLQAENTYLKLMAANSTYGVTTVDILSRTYATDANGGQAIINIESKRCNTCATLDAQVNITTDCLNLNAAIITTPNLPSTKPLTAGQMYKTSGGIVIVSDGTADTQQIVSSKLISCDAIIDCCATTILTNNTLTTTFTGPTGKVITVESNCVTCDNIVHNYKNTLCFNLSDSLNNGIFFNGSTGVTLKKCNNSINVTCCSTCISADNTLCLQSKEYMCLTTEQNFAGVRTGIGITKRDAFYNSIDLITECVSGCAATGLSIRQVCASGSGGKFDIINFGNVRNFCLCSDTSSTLVLPGICINNVSSSIKHLCCCSGITFGCTFAQIYNENNVCVQTSTNKIILQAPTIQAPLPSSQACDNSLYAAGSMVMIKKPGCTIANPTVHGQVPMWDMNCSNWCFGTITFPTTVVNCNILGSCMANSCFCRSLTSDSSTCSGCNHMIDGIYSYNGHNSSICFIGSWCDHKFESNLNSKGTIATTYVSSKGETSAITELSALNDCNSASTSTVNIYARTGVVCCGGGATYSNINLLATACAPAGSGCSTINIQSCNGPINMCATSCLTLSANAICLNFASDAVAYSQTQNRLIHSCGLLMLGNSAYGIFTAPNDGEFLKFSSTCNRWMSKTLTDIQNDGDVLTYSTSCNKWIAKPIDIPEKNLYIQEEIPNIGIGTSALWIQKSPDGSITFNLVEG